MPSCRKAGPRDEHRPPSLLQGQRRASAPQRLPVRQSTIKQVLTNTESTLRQYDLRGRAIAFGWSSDQLSEAELHFLRSRMRGGILSKARRGELITPLPIGLAYDAAGHAGPDPDTSIQQAIRHLFTTFAATGSAHAVVKTFNDAGLLFPRRHRKGPRKGELDWAPLAHSAVLRILHNPRYAGVFCFGRHRDCADGDGTYIRQVKPREE